LVFIACACDRGIGYCDGGRVDNYIQSYRSITELNSLPVCYECPGNESLYDVVDASSEISINDLRFLLFDFLHWCKHQDICYTEVHNNPANEDKFQELAEKYGDTNFDGCYVNTYQHTVIADVIQKIDVIAVEDYDSKHKAGDSLADIIKVNCFSVRQYLENDYVFPDNEKYYCENLLLDEFNQVENYLISIDRFFLSLNMAPDVSGQYTFRVRYQETDGTDLTADVSANLTGKN
jgi:hypothetical protein